MRGCDGGHDQTRLRLNRERRVLQAESFIFFGQFATGRILSWVYSALLSNKDYVRNEGGVLVVAFNRSYVRRVKIFLSGLREYKDSTCPHLFKACFQPLFHQPRSSSPFCFSGQRVGSNWTGVGMLWSTYMLKTNSPLSFFLQTATIGTHSSFHPHLELLPRTCLPLLICLRQCCMIPIAADTACYSHWCHWYPSCH